MWGEDVSAAKPRVVEICKTCLTCWLVHETSTRAIGSTARSKRRQGWKKHLDNVGTAAGRFSVVLFEAGSGCQIPEAQLGGRVHGVGIDGTRCTVWDSNLVVSCGAFCKKCGTPGFFRSSIFDQLRRWVYDAGVADMHRVVR